MRLALIRFASFVLMVAILLTVGTAEARSPGGRSGKGGGARSASKPNVGNAGMKKKKKIAPAKAGQGGANLNGFADKLGGPSSNFNNGALNKLQGAGAGAGNFQGLQDKLGGKLPSREGEFPASAQNSLASRTGEHQQNAQSAVQNFQQGAQPFTAEWYAQHPNAWQQTHPHADAWAAAATTAGVATWLGWAAYESTEDDSESGDTYYNTNYYETPTEDDTDETVEDTSTDEEASDDTAAEPEDVAAGDWLALGNYTVLNDGGLPTSRFLQLSVDRQGNLRGTYYDGISNTSQNLRGHVEQSTQQAQWRLDSNPQVVFRTNLADLTELNGSIQLNYPSGQQETWRITRAVR
jgi:hypothetical protein